MSNNTRNGSRAAWRADAAARIEQAARAIDTQVGSDGAPPHPTKRERADRGRAERERVPYRDLGRWRPGPDRIDPVELLVEQERPRVRELLPLRHAKMAEDAFSFYRGSAVVMAADLATMPHTSPKTMRTQICGDAHLSNFGVFAAPDRSLVFDLNDFDETLPGPWEWDLKRLATSVVLAARTAKPAVSAASARRAVRETVRAYQRAMNMYGRMDELTIWYHRLDATELLAAARRAAGRDGIGIDHVGRQARARDRWSAVTEFTERKGGRVRLGSDPPALVRFDLDEAGHTLVEAVLARYRGTLQEDRGRVLSDYDVISVGHKVVGVGSIGMLALVAVLQGKDVDDLLVLQVKQAQQSVLEAYLAPSTMPNHGERVVRGQRLMQAASDSFLGWIDVPSTGLHFYVRQLRDMKWAPDPEALNATSLRLYGALCGQALARAHARAGDEVAVAAYVGDSVDFVDAIGRFAESYADQAEKDLRSFRKAIKAKRIKTGDVRHARDVALAVQAKALDVDLSASASHADITAERTVDLTAERVPSVSS